jgi:hypothetical protein
MNEETAYMQHEEATEPKYDQHNREKKKHGIPAFESKSWPEPELADKRVYVSDSLLNEKIMIALRARREAC